MTGQKRPTRSESRRLTELVGVRLHPDEHAQAVARAALDGVTVPELIRTAFAAYLAKGRTRMHAPDDGPVRRCPSCHPLTAVPVGAA